MNAKEQQCYAIKATFESRRDALLAECKLRMELLKLQEEKALKDIMFPKEKHVMNESYAKWFQLWF